MRSSSAFVMAAAAGLVAAQLQVGNDSFPIVPSQVPIGTRAQWCVGQRNTCRELCGGAAQTQQNSCDQETLVYECTCNNGTEPGLQYYDSSLYSMVCQSAFGQCNAQNAGDADAQQKCKTDIESKCGTLKLDSVPKTTSESSTTSSTPTETAAAETTSAAPTDPPSAAISTTVAGNTIAAIVALGLFAALF